MLFTFILFSLAILSGEELYDIELLRDQILPVFPGYIDSSKASKEFYVHIEPHKTEMIQASIAALAEKPEVSFRKIFLLILIVC